MNDVKQSRMQNSTSGWISFASFMMIIAGFFQMISGLVALLKPTLYYASENHLLLLDYTAWGWLHLITGFVLLVSAASLLAGKLWGRAVAITLALISAVMNFGFIWAYPVWSIMIVLLDIMIIYAVVIYGGENNTYGE